VAEETGGRVSTRPASGDPMAAVATRAAAAMVAAEASCGWSLCTREEWGGEHIEGAAADACDMLPRLCTVRLARMGEEQTRLIEEIAGRRCCCADGDWALKEEGACCACDCSGRCCCCPTGEEGTVTKEPGDELGDMARRAAEGERVLLVVGARVLGDDMEETGDFGGLRGMDILGLSGAEKALLGGRAAYLSDCTLVMPGWEASSSSIPKLGCGTSPLAGTAAAWAASSSRRCCSARAFESWARRRSSSSSFSPTSCSSSATRAAPRARRSPAAADPVVVRCVGLPGGLASSSRIGNSTSDVEAVRAQDTECGRRLRTGVCTRGLCTRTWPPNWTRLQTPGASK